MRYRSIRKFLCVAALVTSLCAGCSGHEQELASAERHVQTGMAELDAGRDSNARASFAAAAATLETAEHSVATLPAESLADWGIALHRLGENDLAADKLETALTLEPTLFAANLEYGLLLSERGDADSLARAVTQLKLAVKTRPGNPDALYQLGLAFLQLQDYSQAADLIQRAVVATDPEGRQFTARNRSLAQARAGLPLAEPNPDMPNILLIVVDTLRADHLGSYGYERNISPNIDALARTGVRFEQAISTAPWTAPSLASLFTSLYPSVHGLDGGITFGEDRETAGRTLPFAIQKTLKSGQLTLAESLRRNGYRTAGFVSNVYANSIFGFSQGFETFNDEHTDYMNFIAMAKRRAGDTNRFVFDWLDAKPREPFFLFVHYNDAHWPYNPPDPYGREFIADYAGDLTPLETGKVVERKGQAITDLSKADLDYIIGLYDGEIAYLDANFGRLLDKLDSLGLKRNLLTVVTADHGEEFLDHGSASHGHTLYEEQIHVPLLMHYPGELEATSVDTQVSLVDVMPTILELAGVVTKETRLQGRSLVPTMMGEAAVTPPAFSEATLTGNKKSIRTSDGAKLIVDYATDERLMFNLLSDPNELTDQSARQQDLTINLLENLNQHSQMNQAARFSLYGNEDQNEAVELDQKMQQRLRSLGYIQ